MRFERFLKFIPIVAFFIIICQITLFGGENSSEKLTRLMKDIDRDYKEVEVISGYYDYSDEDWNTIYDAGLEIAKATEEVQKDYGRPDNPKYEQLMEQMRIEAKKMAYIVEKKAGQEGSLEDVQWQVRKLRNTCAECHRLLNIHIYPQLYPKKKRRRHEGIFKDWGKPE